MKLIDIMRRAGRSLRNAKIRTALTSLAIAVGGFAIMVSLMAGEGARQYIDRVLSANMDPNSLMIARDESIVSLSGGGQSQGLREYDPNSLNMLGTDFRAVTMSDITQLRARDDLENVEPLYQLQPKRIQFSVQPDKQFIAQMEARDSTITVGAAAGRQLASGDQLAGDEATIPESYLETLGVSAEQAVGSTVTVTVAGTTAEAAELSRTLTIVTVTQRTPDQVMSPSYLYVSPGTAKELTDFATRGTDQYQKYLGAMAIAADGHAPDDIKPALKEDGFYVATAKDLQGMIFTFINILQNVVLGFGLLALMVSVFGIINTQYISVLERTQQIGLMKALGARRRDVGRLFRLEAAWIGLIGGAVGVLGAWGGAAIFNPMISNWLGLGDHSLLIFQPHMAVVVVTLLIVVAMLAGWFPSRKAAKLDPIEALRTE